MSSPFLNGSGAARVALLRRYGRSEAAPTFRAGLYPNGANAGRGGGRRSRFIDKSPQQTG